MEAAKHIEQASRRIPEADPIFAQLGQFAGLFELPWDAALAEFNRRAASMLPDGLRFAEQDQSLIDDGLSYEQRIGLRRQIAMRRDSLHDLYGALMWLQWPQTKWAIHQGQMAGIREVGAKQRTRRQQALTHIDEAGTVLVSDDVSLLDALQSHDWLGLLTQRRAAWERAQVFVIGHALFELRHCRPHDLQASKVIAFHQPQTEWFALDLAQRMADLDRRVAAAIISGQAAADPKDQSTLPLAAVPAWDARNRDPDFIASAPCFRPRPAGRIYAPPIRF
ncbi:MAG TPA: DUF3025 domain-containing protein [Xanthomonadales bacterium]|nr:DUF3025 domain-containing protein [Xanthomonadales bacterium]